MLKDEQCKELADVRVKLESELEDLTASLFEEAHKMVHDANMKEFIAVKKRKEAVGEVSDKFPNKIQMNYSYCAT